MCHLFTSFFLTIILYLNYERSKILKMKMSNKVIKFLIYGLIIIIALIIIYNFFSKGKDNQHQQQSQQLEFYIVGMLGNKKIYSQYNEIKYITNDKEVLLSEAIKNGLINIENLMLVDNIISELNDGGSVLYKLNNVTIKPNVVLLKCHALDGYTDDSQTENRYIEDIYFLEKNLLGKEKICIDR